MHKINNRAENQWTVHTLQIPSCIALIHLSVCPVAPAN